MEPQTIPHFFEFLMHGRLPGDDRKTSRPLLTVEETRNISRPFPDWAPAPFNVQRRSTGEWIGIRIGSFEDSARLWPIAKELHAMKSRLWEGIPPLSERRWKELQLDDPRHFKDACQYFIAVIDVFAYLNHPRTKNALRTTYNLIWDHLKVFEQAINAKRRAEAEDGLYEEVSVTGLWYQYIRAHYDVICDNAHQWVIEHIDRIREPIVLELGSHQPAQSDQIDDRQQELTDMIHDLAENTSQADYTICMPMDGYKGNNLPAQERLPLTAAHKAAFREDPISWSANINWRASDYSQRVRFLDRKEMYDHYEREGLLFLDAPRNDPERLVITCISQIDAQTMARHELRGPSEEVDVDRWIDYGRRPTPRFKGFAAFRLCHEHDDGKWKEFKTKFEADIADWGWGKKGIDDVRQACKIHWIEGEEAGDIEAAKK
jgi:nicotinamide mononucleotide adenylyltransferase